jgi:hypothetical protein
MFQCSVLVCIYYRCKSHLHGAKEESKYEIGVLTAVTVNIAVLWDVTPCSLMFADVS